MTAIHSLGSRFEVTIVLVFWLVIGPNWMATRLHEPDDVVRREIAVALQRRIHLLPILVDTTMPAAADLPSDVQGLTRWQAFGFDLGNYEGSVKRLAKRVSGILC